MSSSITGSARWPPGRGEMAARIRAHAWHRSSLGTAVRWPVPLRTATELMIGSAVPTLLILGSDGVLLYNDALVPFLGSQHPALLGCALSTGSAAAAAKFHTLATALQDGETVITDDNWLGLTETEILGLPRLSCSPIGGAVGDIGGIWAQMLTQASRQQLQGRSQVLVAELQHRTRNLLALVRSIAAETIGRGSDIGPAQYQIFIERLAALSRAQSLITRADAERADLESLLRAELAALRAVDSDQIEVHGPRVALTPVHAQTMALVTHELATNAMKHGALRSRKGRLAVSWTTELHETDSSLHLVWQESGVDMPVDAGKRRGFGRELIEEALQFSLDARTELRFCPDGIECSIDLPLGNVHVPTALMAASAIRAN